MVLYTCWYPMTLNYSIPSLFTVPQIKTPPISTGSYDSLYGAGRCLGWKRICCRRGTPCHSQVHLAHMHTDGGIWGWWILSAALNLASIYPLDAPSWMWRGCILVGITSSEAGGTAGEADYIAWPAGSETSGPVDSWGGRWKTVVDGLWQTFLWGGEAEDVEGCDTVPLRSP